LWSAALSSSDPPRGDEVHMQALLDNFADMSALMRVYPLLLQGLIYTMMLAVAALPLGLLLGLAIAVTYSFHHRWVNIALLIYIDIFRAFPVVVLLILVFYGLPFLGLTLGGFGAAVLAIVLNNSGYYGEIFRAGIESVPRGQYEAARALGFKPLHVVIYIVLPQAVRNVLAPLASNSLELIKATSIGALVALPELLRSARVAQEQTYNPTPLMAAAVIFFVLLYPIARWVARLERQALAAR
jgi:polar amino acid transport system permease protein